MNIRGYWLMWFEYERRKRLIQEKNLPSEQYEEEIKKLLAECETEFHPLPQLKEIENDITE